MPSAVAALCPIPQVSHCRTLRLCPFSWDYQHLALNGDYSPPPFPRNTGHGVPGLPWVFTCGRPLSLLLPRCLPLLFLSLVTSKSPHLQAIRAGPPRKPFPARLTLQQKEMNEKSLVGQHGMSQDLAQGRATVSGVGAGIQSPMSAGCSGDAGKGCSCVTLGKSSSLAVLVYK